MQGLDPYKGKSKQELLEALLKDHFYNADTGSFTRKNQTTTSPKVGEDSANINANGYKQFYVCGKLFLVHRLVWLIENGEMPNGSIDHINQDKSDNRIQNLRLVPHSENMKNKKLYAQNKYGIAGVYWYKKNKKWASQIRNSKKLYSLGYFDNFFDACCARKSAELKFNFSFSHGVA